MHESWETLAIVPKIAIVTIDEIPGELNSGVQYKIIRNLGDKIVIKNRPDKDKSFFKSLDCLLRRHDGSYMVRLESFFRKNGVTPWELFNYDGLDIVDEISFTKEGEKRCKFIYNLYVSVNSTISFLQFYCSGWRVRYMNKYFHKGEIITIFLCAKECKSVPLVTVQPRHGQTYLCMPEGQVVQLISDNDSYSMQWKAIRGGSLSHIKNVKLNNADKFQSIGKNICIDYFKYNKRTEHPEFVYFKQKDGNDYQVVCVSPMTNCGSPCLVVQNPVVTSTMLTANVECVKILLLNYRQLRVHPDCPAKIVYVFNGELKTEIKVKILSPCAQLLLEKNEDHWLLRLP